MPRIRGRRSARDAVAWTCQPGHVNPPQRHLFFDIPAFICSCGCGEKYSGDFELCLGDIKVNGHKLLGDTESEGHNGTCIQAAFAKQMEILKREKAILQKKDPDLVPKMSAADLIRKFENKLGKEKNDALTEVVHTALILKEEGVKSMDSEVTYKVSNVSVIKRTDHAKIAANLADGFPLNAGILVGKTFKSLRFCRKYKPPLLADFYKAKRMHISGHAVLLVGAGRKNGNWYYFFLNSHHRFCLRFNAKGKRIEQGIGKVVAKRLFRNVVRLSRFKEKSRNDSLLKQDNIKVSDHNKQLMASP